MPYLEIAPLPALSRAVVCFWAVRPEAAGPVARERRVYPDGCFDLVFDLDRPGLPLSSAAVGPMTRAIVVAPAAGAHFGIRFRPGRASRLFGPPLSELRDLHLPAEDFLGAGVRELGERLAREATDWSRARMAARFLVRRLEALGGDRFLAARLQLALGAARDGARVGDLAVRLGITARQLERTFLREVGLRPKELFRLARFRRGLERLRTGSVPTLARLADELGYADQAHFTREFARFAGQSPSAVLRSVPSGEPASSDLFKSGDRPAPILSD